jgi:trehalose/maltose transport system substrate-binding protein
MVRRRMLAVFLMLVLLLPLIAACGQEEPESALESPPTSVQSPLVEMSPLPEEETEEEPPDVAEEAESPEAVETEVAEEEQVEGEPPAVPNAEQARQFEGTTIRYYGDTVGLGAQLDQVLAARFTEETGIVVEVIPKPEGATEAFSAYQRLFQAQSPDIDVMMIDVIWPGALGQHLADLSQALGQEAEQHYPGIIENNTVEGRLVAMPWFGDFGMLYYRTDLLEQYGFDGPPETWTELEEQARTVMEGEMQNNPNFTGFVFQGNAYEGLTTNALEWLASNGVRFIEEGEVTINDPAAIEMLNRTRDWVGDIAPRGVTGYQEEDARNVFQGGNAMFMRNWPYAYAAGQLEDSPIRGIFDVAPLPHGEGGESTGTVGGWQLAVSNYSQNQEAAAEFVRYMTSPEVQTYRAIEGSFVPTIPEVAQDPQVLEAMPFLEPMEDVVRVTRPSTELAERYNEGSTAIFQGVNQILNGQDAAQVVPQIEQRLQRLLGR